ncbi:hypothetical protein IW261DRAFT_1570318 [Armillaria novae-zelandiae]|uniref:Uncharacterized protein n=1 Tax=Armillaria novae-zelandiae TaxID=153914 RepID=A0AA39NW45_9AGAR|nr:hypothetical protein IW261DRAFT_1570318 [Armillaria novae-zelandiae]
MSPSHGAAQSFEDEFFDLDMPQILGLRSDWYLEDSMFFEDSPPSESAFINNFISFGSGSLYHPYTDISTLEVAIIEQRLWLVRQDLQFESAVLDRRVHLFFECLYEQWFCTWAPDDVTMHTENDPDHKRADSEQRKIEKFTLYIMSLHHRWIELSSLPG